MQLSISLLDYVIVHELAHIGQPRHMPTKYLNKVLAGGDPVTLLDRVREALAAEDGGTS